MQHIYQLTRDKSILNNQPISVTLELNTTCNLRCNHCYIDDYTNKGLSIECLDQIFNDLRKAGTLWLNFTGGEVLLREDFIDILTLARSYHFSCSFFSNGIYINQKYIDSFKKLFVNNIGISLYSLKESVHEQVTGKKGSFNKTKCSIERLIKNEIDVTIKTPILNINYQEIDDIVEYSRRIGCSVQFSPIILPKLNGDNANVLNYSISQEVLNSLIDNDNIFSNTTEKTVDSFEADSTFCSALHCGGYIDAKGNVFPCNQLPYLLGNVLDNPFSRIWEGSPQIRQIRNMRNKDLTNCQSCDLKEHCTRCPGHAIYESNNILGCSFSAQKIALARKEKMLYSSVSEIDY